MKTYLETEILILREIIMIAVVLMVELDTNLDVHRFVGKKPEKIIGESRSMIGNSGKQYT